MRQISEMRRTISAVAATAALCVLALLTVACARPAETAEPPAPDPDAAIGESGVLNGHTLQSEIDGRKLTLAQIVERGESLFTASFNALDGAGRPETTDVGVNNFRPPHTFPDNFNRISGPDANSCLGCHNQPRAGGSADNAANVFVLADRLHFVNFDGQEGDGGDLQTLKTVGNERAPLGLFGSGYVELLAREMTSDLHAIRDDARRRARRAGADVTAELSSKGVSFGRMTARPDGSLLTDRVEGVNDDLVIRPFMQKGTIVSLREFAVKAMNQHFGMQASERFGDSIDHDADGMADELTRGDITALVMFQATLPAPVRADPPSPATRDAAERGEALFTTLGCVTCHIPELPLESAVFSEPNPFNPSGKLSVFDVDEPYTADLTALDGINGNAGAPNFRRDERGRLMIPVFTDLKRHKMGDILDNEALEEEGVPTDEWLTRKLWGFASEPPFLHHGRATLISEAILSHGGEADASRAAFASLSADDQASVIEFLETLQHPPEDTTSGGRDTTTQLSGAALWTAIAGAAVVGGLAALVGVAAAMRIRRGKRVEP